MSGELQRSNPGPRDPCRSLLPPDPPTMGRDAEAERPPATRGSTDCPRCGMPLTRDAVGFLADFHYAGCEACHFYVHGRSEAEVDQLLNEARSL